MINSKIILNHELAKVKVTHRDLQRFFKNPQRFEKSAAPEQKYALSRAIAHEYIRFSIERENRINFFAKHIDDYELLKMFILLAVFNLDKLLNLLNNLENDSRPTKNKKILALATTKIFGQTLRDLSYWMIQGLRRIPGNVFQHSSFERMAALANIDEMLLPYLLSLAKVIEKDH